MSCSKGCNFCGEADFGKHTGNCCSGRSCSGGTRTEEPDETFTVLDLMRAIVAQEHEKQMRELRGQQMAEEDAERRAGEELRKAELRQQDEQRRAALVERLEERAADEEIRANEPQIRVEYVEAVTDEQVEHTVEMMERYRLA